jgi:hypothetical protein
MASSPLFNLKSYDDDEQAFDDSTRRSEAVTDRDGGAAERSDSRNGLWFWEIE